MLLLLFFGVTLTYFRCLSIMLRVDQVMHSPDDSVINLFSVGTRENVNATLDEYVETLSMISCLFPYRVHWFSLLKSPLGEICF